MNIKTKHIFLNVFFVSFFFSAFSQKPIANAGANQSICAGGQCVIGGNPTAQGGHTPYTYLWRPSNTLSDSTIANPTASPSQQTTYTLLVTDSADGTAHSSVTVSLYNYTLSVTHDTTIKEGQTITLHAQGAGATGYYWYPAINMYNPTTSSPDVFPESNQLYQVSVVYAGGCTIYGKVQVTVIPNSELYFYNSFTPNSDGANDFFYVGNIGLYPDNTLEIYNRYGQKVFSITSYNNDWDGKYFGAELPAGTYFYILDTHASAGKFKGHVNIIR